MTAQERFDRIYSTTYDRLYSFVKRYAWSDSSTQDVLQECYLRLWEKMAEVRDDEKLMPMLRTIALRITIDSVRKKARELSRAEAFHAGQDKITTADERLHLQEIMARYRAAVDGLPIQQQKVFRMHREEGLSHGDVARELGISPHTVKRHMNEALHTLRSQLNPEMMALVGLILASKGF